MNYPNKIKINPCIKTNNVNYGNRGMSLENDLNITNQYYADIDKAFIYKKAIPIKVTEVDYKNKGKLIKKAYFESPSTTDYNGIYKGKYIDFEAKETNNKTSFPLNNIHNHQIEHIRNINRHNGICFIMVRFNKLDQTYLLMSDKFIDYIDKCEQKSIPIIYFKEHGYLIKEKYQPRVDYLEIIDKMEEIYDKK